MYDVFIVPMMEAFSHNLECSSRGVCRVNFIFGRPWDILTGYMFMANSIWLVAIWNFNTNTAQSLIPTTAESENEALSRDKASAQGLPGMCAGSVQAESVSSQSVGKHEEHIWGVLQRRYGWEHACIACRPAQRL